MNSIRGFFRYLTFGLRKEWVLSFINQGNIFLLSNTLGPKQLDAFIYYLRDCELIDKKNNLTELFPIIKDIYQKESINSKFLWEILWINLCFNSSLFKWWSCIYPKTYSRNDMVKMMTQAYGKSNRYLINGYLALAGTLENTPIGTELKQGIIKKDGRARIIFKEGNPDIHPLSVLYNLYKFAERNDMQGVNIEEIKESSLSPQKIFAIDTQRVKTLLRELWDKGLFEVNYESNTAYILLREDLRSIDILKSYTGGVW